MDSARAARPARPPSEKWVGMARRLMGEQHKEVACGPYVLHTDSGDQQLLESCDLLAQQIDRLYRIRYGLEPIGQPAEGIFLFARRKDFQAFAKEDGRLRVGYAGYSSPLRGFLALYGEGQPRQQVLSTLTHELTHLVNRRALGGGLPPWLSEGLADGIGDTATEEGFQPLVAVKGTEAQARRLITAYQGGKARSLERLVALSRKEFDRETVSFDYEQSAIFVRFLLADAELKKHFRDFLGRLATGEEYSPLGFIEMLGLSWEDLNRRFEVWLLSRG